MIYRDKNKNGFREDFRGGIRKYEDDKFHCKGGRRLAWFLKNPSKVGRQAPEIIYRFADKMDDVFLERGNL